MFTPILKDKNSYFWTVSSFLSLSLPCSLTTYRDTLRETAEDLTTERVATLLISVSRRYVTVHYKGKLVMIRPISDTARTADPYSRVL